MDTVSCVIPSDALDSKTMVNGKGNKSPQNGKQNNKKGGEKQKHPSSSSPVAKQRRRSISEVDPNTPPSHPPSDVRFRELITEAIIPVLARLDKIQETQVEIQEEAGYFHSSIHKIEAENCALRTRVELLEQENHSLRDRVLKIETHSRRSNLRFHGLPEKNNEDAETVVKDFLASNDIVLDDRAIERAHRLGRPQNRSRNNNNNSNNRIRPIIVCFNNFKDRQTVWKECGHRLFPRAHNTKHVREDFPDEVEKNRAKLLTVASAALKTKMPGTQSAPKVTLLADKLIINSEPFTVHTLDRLPEHLKPQALYTKTHEDKVAFFTAISPLSNHFMSPFSHNGVKYNCVEQFLMAEKARACGDEEALQSIMDEDDPVKQKKHGRSLKDLDVDAWQQEAQKKLLPGLTAKFEQNDICRTILMNTGKSQILEANPHDHFWGTGIPLHSDDIWDISKHRGKNVMGESLMLVRNTLNEPESIQEQL